MHLLPEDLAALKYLIEDWDLDLFDLNDLGDEMTLNRILNGKQALTPEQLDRLCIRFNASPETFVDEFK